jgi:hypothetical protein
MSSVSLRALSSRSPEGGSGISPQGPTRRRIGEKNGGPSRGLLAAEVRPPARDTARAMSQENVEAFKRGFEAYNRRDIAALLQELDPEVEWYSASRPTLSRPTKPCARVSALGAAPATERRRQSGRLGLTTQNGIGCGSGKGASGWISSRAPG